MPCNDGNFQVRGESNLAQNSKLPDQLKSINSKQPFPLTIPEYLCPDSRAISFVMAKY